MKIILTLVLTTLLTGCGYHWRGHEPLPHQLQVLYLQSEKPYSALNKSLRHALQRKQVSLVSSADQAPLTLHILYHSTQHDVNNVSSSAQIRLVQLTQRMEFQLSDAKGNVFVHPQIISASRQLTINASRMLGSGEEKQTLQDEMNRELISKLLLKLTTRSTLDALAQHQHAATT